MLQIQFALTMGNLLYEKKKSMPRQKYTYHCTLLELRHPSLTTILKLSNAKKKRIIKILIKADISFTSSFRFYPH